MLHVGEVTTTAAVGHVTTVRLDPGRRSPVDAHHGAVERAASLGHGDGDPLVRESAVDEHDPTIVSPTERRSPGHEAFDGDADDVGMVDHRESVGG